MAMAMATIGRHLLLGLSLMLLPEWAAASDADTATVTGSALNGSTLNGTTLTGTTLTGTTLTGTTWRLTAFQSMDDAVGRIETAWPDHYTIRFGPSGRAAFRLHCNRGSASWQVEPGANGDSGRLTFGPLTVTRALCPDDEPGERLARDAEYIRAYLLKDDALHLSLMADGGIYSFDPILRAAPHEGGPRSWKVVDAPNGLNLRAASSTDSDVIGKLANGMQLANLGCRPGAVRHWCDVQRIEGGKRGYVAAEYLAPAIGPDGAIPSGSDDSASRAGQNAFDATGTVPCNLISSRTAQRCDFSVARSGGGYATVVITSPRGMERILFYALGKPIGHSTSEVDRVTGFRAEREGDLYRVELGDESYEIPDAVVLGG